MVVWLKGGTGIYEVDFQTYTFEHEQALFLSPNQYFRVLHGELDVFTISLSSLLNTPDSTPHDQQARVLFDHVIEVGSVKITPYASDVFNQLKSNKADSRKNPSTDLIKRSVELWLAQQPFGKISPDELDVVFDLKGLIDRYFKKQPDTNFYADNLKIKQRELYKITKTGLDRTLPQLQAQRVLLEAERNLFFTTKSSKEITYDLGFNDPAYFNRFFKQNTGLTTMEFRQRYHEFKDQIFVNDLLELIEMNYKDHRSVSFYASKLHLSPKSLSAKVKKSIDKNVSDLISSKVVAEAHKRLLDPDIKISSIAYELGFDTPSQFSHFFKRNKSVYPSKYRSAHLQAAH